METASVIEEVKMEGDAFVLGGLAVFVSGVIGNATVAESVLTMNVEGAMGDDDAESDENVTAVVDPSSVDEVVSVGPRLVVSLETDIEPVTAAAVVVSGTMEAEDEMRGKEEGGVEGDRVDGAEEAC
jgi:hypothetical protein